MKRETIIGLVLLALFVAFTILGGQIANAIVFMVGCFAVGWKIPDVATLINRKFFSKEV